MDVAYRNERNSNGNMYKCGRHGCGINLNALTTQDCFMSQRPKTLDILREILGKVSLIACLARIKIKCQTEYIGKEKRGTKTKSNATNLPFKKLSQA